MTLGDMKLTGDNCFVAMQYYRLILNRTYLVILTESAMLAVVVNGFISAKGPDAMANYMLKNLIVEGDLEDPFSYVDNWRIQDVKTMDLEGDEILKQNRANFRLRYHQIKDVQYDPRRKWGMGYYPHDGKVYVRTGERKTIEFIILGNQSGKRIKNLILSKTFGANVFL